MIEMLNTIFAAAGWLLALVFVLLFLLNLKPFLATRQLLAALRETGDDVMDVIKLLQSGNVSIKALLEVIDREQHIAKNEDLGIPASPEVKARSLTALQNAVQKKK